ncbi:MAG: DUF86 domain-containing protein [Actinobacteria bacterium]|nr:DUF86 domain-containing protein [Actinomycetota bacterium]
MARGDVTDGLIYDAVRMRTMEIGEALKAVPSELLATEPDLPWLEVKRTRDRLAHRYFVNDVMYLRSTILRDLDTIEAAVVRMQRRLGDDLRADETGREGPTRSV